MVVLWDAPVSVIQSCKCIGTVNKPQEHLGNQTVSSWGFPSLPEPCSFFSVGCPSTLLHLILKGLLQMSWSPNVFPDFPLSLLFSGIIAKISIFESTELITVLLCKMTWFCVCVCVWGGVVHVRMCVEARGQSQMSFFRHCPPFC